MGQNLQKATGQQSGVNHIKRNSLVYVKELGQGAFSTVYQMILKSPNGPINMAVKRLNRKDKHELQILSKLDHPSIVKLIGVVDEQLDFMLILEFCEGGSLRSYLKARNGKPISKMQFFDWAEQAARPLEYLRENKLVHKDVKSPNYMVTSEKILKLGDFGLAKNLGQTVCNATETASYQWMAPELMIELVLSPKYDIFALAVVLWELWTVRFPWEGLENQVVLWKICNENERLPIPEDCPEPFKDLLRQCWQTDWKQRPDIVQVLQVITSLPAAEEARQRQIIAGPWNMVREFGQQDGPGKLYDANHMTLSPDGDVVIADKDASQIKIYNLQGELKSIIKTLRKPVQIAVSSDSTCFMVDMGSRITMYEFSGQPKGLMERYCARAPAPNLCGLAIDHTGYLLLSDIDNMCIIYMHRPWQRQDGKDLTSIKVGIKPFYHAVTSQGTIVIADLGTAPQVISNTGQVLHTLNHPVDENKWDLRSVYYHDGIIFVGNSCSILCYSESGKYLGSMPIPHVHPHGLAMTSDNKTLLVSCRKSVKVFTAP